MAVWLGLCVCCHLIVRGRGNSPWPKRLLRGIAWLAGARVDTAGAHPSGSTLIIANHVSWLDIPIMAGATNCAFVAKDGLREHPLMRWLCEENGTVFVDREDRGSIGEQLGSMAEALRSTKPLTLFPEGTVGEGGKLLPFRSSLLKLAENPPLPIRLQPVAIDYGEAAFEFGWPQGESGKSNFLRLLGRRGTVPVTLHFLPELSPDLNRKELARQAHASIASALAPSGSARPSV